MSNVTTIHLLKIFAELQKEFPNVKFNPSKVLSLSTDFINISPESDRRLKEVYLARGFGYYYTNDFDSALSDLENCGEHNVPNFHKLKGMILNNKNFKNYDCYQAISEFTLAIELDRRNHELYYLRALAYLNYEDYNKAINDLNVALNIDVTNNEYYYQRGVVNYICNNYEESIKDFELAIKHGFKKDMSRLNYQLSLAYFNLKDYQKAIDSIDKSIKKDAANIEYQDLKFRIILERETSQLRTQISQLNHEIANKDKLIETLESKDKIQEQLNTATNISEAFEERVSEHKRAKKWFYRALLTNGLIIFILIICFIFCFKDNYLEWYERYLLISTFLFSEIFFLDGYRRNLNLELFYLHKKTVVLSLEKVGEHYFTLEDVGDKKEFREFSLEQYRYLYAQPSFIDKYSVFAKHGNSEVKIDADVSSSQKDKK